MQLISLLLLMMMTTSHSSQARWCQRAANSTSYSCSLVPTDVLESLPLPETACDLHSCRDCVVANATFIVTKQGELVHPTTFLHRPTDRRGNNTVFECSQPSEGRGDETPIPCDCASNCTGSAEFCSDFHCDPTASCECITKGVDYELSHIATTPSVVYPTILSLPVCIFKRTLTRKNRRRLLEFENAIFSQNSLNISFHDSVVTVPTSGKLIARISGKEIIFDVKEDYNIVLPLELVAFRDTLKLIFISTSGRAVYGEVLLEGKTVCRSADCVLCRDFWRQVKCWPTYLAYMLYASLFICTCIIIIFASFALRSALTLCRVGVIFVNIIYRTVRAFLRLCMLGGAVFGSSIRRRILNFQDYLEVHNPQQATNVAIMLLLGLFAAAAGECTQHSILTSEVQNCQSTKGGQNCELFTTAELTLNGLDFESCLWFEDSQRKDLFHLKIKLVSAQCSFSTKREYFTFPVQTRTVSQLACPQNYYCAWGEHCIPNKNFEALTDESLSYPGYTNCHPSSVGSGCTIISRMGCLFYRVYFVPDLLRSYEVRTITGHECSYTIALERLHNGTQELLTIQTSAITTDGIHVTVLGSYNQPQVHLTDKLVLRVGDPSEAYLTTASPQNRPIPGLVGQVQANSSYTTNFIFDQDLVTCEFFETQLRCFQRKDALESLYATKELALPLTRDLHLISVDKGALVSKLLSTSPVRIQLHFTNYKVSLQTVDVCPKISDTELSTKGCYACNMLSEITLMAHSSCHPGTVSVEFQVISLFTRTITLDTEPKGFSIRFNAEHKCYDEKICLKSRNMRHCKLVSFCLDEPSIDLLKLNTSYTKSFVREDSSGSSFLGFLSFPIISNIFFTMKMIGAFLLIICLSITIFSTLLTCCKR